MQAARRTDSNRPEALAASLGVASGSRPRLPLRWVWLGTLPAAVGLAWFLWRTDHALPALAYLWLAAGLALLAVSGLSALHIYRALRHTQQLRASERDTMTRAQCAAALGVVSAGAVHELGTPMMTMGLILERMQAERGLDPELRPLLQAMESALVECRRTLEVLREAACGDEGAGERVAADQFMRGVLHRFAGMVPGVQVDFTCTGLAAPLIVADRALQQGVINLLSNAARVSPEAVRLVLDCRADVLAIRVIDRGPGLTPEAATAPGQIQAGKPASQGWGLGLILTSIAARRLGGDFKIEDAAGGGAVAEILVPLVALQPGESAT
jgi:two-component system sensor histidine kinase RegB